MHVLWHRRQGRIDDLRTRTFVIGEGVGDRKPNGGVTGGQRHDVVRLVVVIGGHPIGNAHFDDGEVHRCNLSLEGWAWSAVAAVQPRGSGFVGETVTVGVHRIVVMNLEARPRPAAFERPADGLNDFDLGEHAVKASGIRQLTEMTHALKGTWCANETKGFDPFAVRDVLPLEKQKGQAKDVIAVQVRDQHAPQVRRRTTGASKGHKGGGGGIDEVLPIEEGHGMKTASGQEGIPGPEEVHAGSHEPSTTWRPHGPIGEGATGVEQG